MRRLGRIVLKGVTVLSLILALGAAWSWVRSYSQWDTIWYTHANIANDHSVSTLRGRVYLEFTHIGSGYDGWDFSQVTRGLHYDCKQPIDHYEHERPTHRFLGLEWFPARDSLNLLVTHEFISVPHAYVLALFLLLPTLRFYLWFRRSRRVLPGHCLKCGYDLRATPDRCPECGTPAASNAAAAE